MPDINTVLKAEITRLARKELKSETDGFRKAMAAYRTEISALKKRVGELESGMKRVGTTARKAPAQAAMSAAEDEATGLRFRAAGMAANRKRLRAARWNDRPKHLRLGEREGQAQGAEPRCNRWPPRRRQVRSHGQARGLEAGTVVARGGSRAEASAILGNHVDRTG
jgi:hypothetical protein